MSIYLKITDEQAYEFFNAACAFFTGITVILLLMWQQIPVGALALAVAGLAASVVGGFYYWYLLDQKYLATKKAQTLEILQAEEIALAVPVYSYFYTPVDLPSAEFVSPYKAETKKLDITALWQRA